MSTAYYRLKKHRQKQSVKIEDKVEVELTSRLDGSNFEVSVEVPIEVSISRNVLCPSQPTVTRNDQNDLLDSSLEYISQNFSSQDAVFLDEALSSPSSQQSSNTDISTVVPSLREKLRDFVVRFRSNMTVDLIENLLDIFRSENHFDLPKSAVGLLQTKSNNKIFIMKSSKNTNGSYVYFGIEEGLKGIMTDEYTEDSISILFNIDGLPLYNSSSQQFWPILGLIMHNDYESNPFIVAVFSGDSKPQNVNAFLEDFVQETITLNQNGLIFGQKNFKIEIVGLSCDTPARSFIKKCKGHGGFYACERCGTRGKTINKKRVYPSISSKLRTKMSFMRQHQPEHHLDGRTRLLDIPKFDPVRSVFLDSMHLLYLGIMKWILPKWILSESSTVSTKTKCQ